MKVRSVSSKILAVLLLLAISFPSMDSRILTGIASPKPSDLYSYEFAVDREGFTAVNILYIAGSGSGSSWVLVPKYSEWINRTIEGEVTEWSLRDAENLTGVPHYFYEALCFSFNSERSEFEIDIQFNLSTAAMIIEPDGIFYSPQIGFEEGNRLEAKVMLPQNFDVKRDQAIAFGRTGSYLPSTSGSNPNLVLFDSIPETENLIRIQIGFAVHDKTLELLTLENGVFIFQTVPRYEQYARGILALYNRTYQDFVDLFNVTLDRADVRFFLPDFNSLLAIGGYVPFRSEKMGEININIVFTRYVKGYIEVIALHELVHHFLWKAGISPQALLWFHEGMAQYVSLEFADKLGYEGSRMMKQELEDGVLQLKQRIGERYGFLEAWSPSRQPSDVGPYYIAAYYVVSRLAEARGGLEYYARFFREVKGKAVEDNAAVGYCLSLAAGESVVETLNAWGFSIPDLYVYSPLLGSAEEVLDGINPVYQPYKFLAEMLYRQAMLNAEEEGSGRMQLFLATAILIARLAPLLTLVTASGILFGAILLALKWKGVFSDH